MKPKWWQFRLRSLLLLVFVSALAAGWWSHRRFCLERMDFHTAQQKEVEQLATHAEIDIRIAEALSLLSYQQEEIEEYERKVREYERGGPFNEERSMAMILNQLKGEQFARTSNFFDESVPERERVAGAIESGYLLAPTDGRPVPQFVDPPTLPLPTNASATAEKKAPRPPPPSPPVKKTLVPSPEQTAAEARAKAIQARVKFHVEQQERYHAAIYRPWQSLQEEKPPQVPARPKEPSN
jgi:hypothetical protein